MNKSMSIRMEARDKILLELISKRDRRPMTQEILFLIQRRAEELGLAEPMPETKTNNVIIP